MPFFRRRAAAAHQSLQEYLRSRLIDEASRPTMDEVLDRVAGEQAGRVRSRRSPGPSGRTVLVVDASVLVVALADDGHEATVPASDCGEKWSLRRSSWTSRLPRCCASNWRPGRSTGVGPS